MFVLIVVITTFFAALWGWRKGLLLMALHLLALLLAYSLAIRGTLPLANVLSQKGWLNGLLAIPVTGVALLLLGSILFSSAAKRVAALAPDEWSAVGKGSSALAGAVMGVAVGLLVVWTTSTLQEAWQWRTQQQLIPEEGSSALDMALRRAAGDLMADGMEMVLGGSAATPVATQWVREPLSVGLALKQVTEQPALRTLFTDPGQYTVLLRGDVMAVQRLPGFQALMADQQTMQLLQGIGLQGSTSAERSKTLATMLVKYAQRFEILRANPEFQALAVDPVLQQRIQKGDWLVLLADNRVRRLVAMLSSGGNQPKADLLMPPVSEVLPQSAIPAQGSLEQEPTKQTDEPVKLLYRWKDADGRLHITDQAPPDGTTADVIQH